MKLIIMVLNANITFWEFYKLGC